MIIGDPYKFAVIIERVKDWNTTVDLNNGYFSLCVDGEIFPKYIINALLKTSSYNLANSLVFS